MKEEYRYLNDEELEAFLKEVEKDSIIKAPVYLKSQIMGEVFKLAEQEEQSSLKSVSIVSGINSFDAVERKKVVQKQFMAYSVKILAAAAMAIFCLTAVPLDFTGIPELKNESRIERRINEDMERYEEENRKLLNDSKGNKSNLGELIENKSQDLVHMWSELTN
ncbi:hypothetical protein [Kineothrix sp. MB12-C1]|uniref:hypothetical protein n=1 Tax=Kineothrix sp. MB12-C1 TaxID=3070215 RepID=UPI0027D26F6A|nr:hypothetical protein [Kineothrix sp. MB12-C1]WMC93096.1 hypothetical protein RBB56_02065 [Kineothrix sp. MB12-C1]